MRGEDNSIYDKRKEIVIVDDLNNDYADDTYAKSRKKGKNKKKSIDP